MGDTKLIQSLLKIGLSKNESMVWLCLLEYGSRGTSWIAKKLKINRGTTHLVLTQLIAKGLAIQVERKDKTQFMASEPEELNRLLLKEESQIRDKRSAYETLLPSLALVKRSHSTEEPSIKHFTGIDGARKVLLECIKAKDRLSRAYMSLFDIIDYVGEEFMQDFTRLRIQRGYTLHLISLKDKDDKASRVFRTENYGQSKTDRRYIKYLSRSLNFPTTMYVFDEKVAIISSKDEDHSMIINSAELSSFQRQIFDLLWGLLPNSTDSRSD